MEWLDTHAGSVQAVATLVLVILTAYYAWASRSLVAETRRTLQAGARATLQARLDRLSEMAIRDPNLFSLLDDPNSTGDETDGRFYLANMFLGIIEEAHMQYRQDRTMTTDDWGAWVNTADAFINRPFIVRYWSRAKRTYEPSFQRFVDERMADAKRDT